MCYMWAGADKADLHRYNDDTVDGRADASIRWMRRIMKKSCVRCVHRDLWNMYTDRSGKQMTYIDDGLLDNS